MAKRRNFTPDFKAQVVLEDLTGVKSPAGICREHRLRSQTLSRWKVEFLERLVEHCYYFINLQHLDMLEAIVLQHVPERYFT